MKPTNGRGAACESDPAPAADPLPDGLVGAVADAIVGEVYCDEKTTSCATCRYSGDLVVWSIGQKEATCGTLDSPRALSCRLNRPQTLHTERGTTWPPVRQNDWCGEWKPKKIGS